MGNSTVVEWLYSSKWALIQGIGERKQLMLVTFDKTTQLDFSIFPGKLKKNYYKNQQILWKCKFLLSYLFRRIRQNSDLCKQWVFNVCSDSKLRYIDLNCFVKSP